MSIVRLEKYEEFVAKARLFCKELPLRQGHVAVCTNCAKESTDKYMAWDARATLTMDMCLECYTTFRAFFAHKEQVTAPTTFVASRVDNIAADERPHKKSKNASVVLSAAPIKEAAAGDDGDEESSSPVRKQLGYAKGVR